MRTEMLTRAKHRESVRLPRTEEDRVRVAARLQLGRVHRLKINVAAWILGTTLVTALWVLAEWRANGAFRHFGNQGNAGDWNPTLWALGVGVWGLVVGIMALRVHFERPPTEADVERAAKRLMPLATATGAPTDAELRRRTRARLAALGRLRFHVAAWVLGMVVVTPLWALIEWQDNGGFERWSDNGHRGDWEPWILPVAGVWALLVAGFALKAYFDRSTAEAASDREVGRRGSRS